MSNFHSGVGWAGVIALIPARDEAGTIGEVVRQVRQELDIRVVVISDASTDATAELGRSAGARVIDLPLQIGAWGATQTGIRYARRKGFERVVTLDADGQHDPASLPALLDAMRETGADVVIGTSPGRLSRAKRLAWAWFRMLTGLAVEDLTSGLRVYGPRALPILASSEATLLDYQDVGVLLLLRKYGLRIHEVPVTMHPRHEGKSRVFSSWFTVARYMTHTTLLCVARRGRLGSAPVATAR